MVLLHLSSIMLHLSESDLNIGFWALPRLLFFVKVVSKFDKFLEPLHFWTMRCIAVQCSFFYPCYLNLLIATMICIPNNQCQCLNIDHILYNCRKLNFTVFIKRQIYQTYSSLDILYMPHNNGFF